MNTKNISIFICIMTFGILISVLIYGMASAQTTTDVNNTNIQYPIAELGNCQNKNLCKSYCDKPVNMTSCIAYAEKNNLMTTNEISNAKKFLNAGEKGPGGCTTKDSCESYCDDINRIDECIAYAEKTGILPPEELEEAKQVQSAIARGIKPPACKNKKECDVYCEDPGNMKVCIAFGEAAGFLKGKDLEDAKKMISAVEKGAIPPPCKGKEACDTYCSQPENMEACMTFAQAAGFMSPKEAEESQKVLSAIKKGVKPPACKGKEECDKYCAEDSHVEECIAFSVAAGFMSEKDAEMARKTGGKGPGGCSGKEECDAFCKNPENQETCFNFGKENGLISPEQLKEMEERNNKFQPGPGAINPGGQMMPPQVQENQPNQYPGDNTLFREIREGMPLNQNLPFNEMMSPDGTFPPPEEGMQPPPPLETQQMMPQGGIQQMVPQNVGTPPPSGPGPNSTSQPGTAPQTEPGSFNPPAPTPSSRLPKPPNSQNATLFNQSLIKMIANIFLSQ